MKKSIGIILGISAAVLLLASCTEEGEQILDEQTSASMVIEDVSAAATADAVFEDVDDVADFGNETQLSINARGVDNQERGYESCAEVSYDEETQTMTIDFGEEGCTGRDGKLRTGKILLTHTGSLGEIGEKRILTFEDFTVDSISVEGIRTIENISDPENELQRVFAITLEGGKLTFPDETEITRDSDRTRTVTLTEEGRRLTAEVVGLTSGINREGLEYSHTIDSSTPLLFKHECKDISGSVPVSGILVIQIEGESEKTVDYGDGTCDNLATVTQDGITEEIEVNPRQRRRPFRRFR